MGWTDRGVGLDGEGAEADRLEPSTTPHHTERPILTKQPVEVDFSFQCLPLYCDKILSCRSVVNKLIALLNVSVFGFPFVVFHDKS